MAAFIRKLEDANGNDQYPITKACCVFMENGDNLEDKVTVLETTTGGITFGIEDGEYGYYKPGEGDEPEFVGFRSQADVDAASQSGYDSGYAAAEADIKVAHKLTLMSGQIGSNVDILDGWYTDLDATAVYGAGQESGKNTAYNSRSVSSLGRKSNSSTAGNNTIYWEVTAERAGRYIAVVRTYEHIAYDGVYMDNAQSSYTLTSLSGADNTDGVYVLSGTYAAGATIKIRVMSGTSPNTADCWLF